MSKKNVDARMTMFGRLAMESGLVTYDDIVTCIEEQEKIRSEGLAAPKLGEVMIERGLLTKQDVDLILKMQSNPGGLIGRQLVERGLVTQKQLREALDEQAELVHAGIAPPRIGEMLVDKGIITAQDLQKLLHKKKEVSGSLFGEFLVTNHLVKQEDIDKCLTQQKAAAAKGANVPRLGELLVSNGVLRKEQIELYSQRHAQSRRQISPPIATAAVKSMKKTRRTLGEYEILDSLGQHADGVTFRAIHTASGAIVVMHHFNTADTVVAIPVGELDDSQAPNTEDIAGTFAHKVRQAQLLRGQATQVILACENINDNRAVIADYIDGITLDRVILEKSHIEWTWAAEILHDFSAILQQASELGINHDDIRPGSIIVDGAGKAKLSLWCYTSDPVANRDWVAQKHRNLSYYISPERINSGPSEKADMFSLGLTLVHALTGTPPLTADSASESVQRFNPGEAMQELALDLNLPLEFVNIISGMIEVDPENRPASFAEIEQRTRQFMESEGLEPGHGVSAVARQMLPAQADQIIDSYLSTNPVAQKAKRVPLSRLVSLFLGPLAAMALIMLSVTTIYKLTQASHGLMIRANWLDHQGDRPGALSLYRMISSLYPKSEAVQKRYFDLAMEVRDHGEAELALEKLTPLHPEKRLEYLELQADLQVWQKRFASAAELYGRVIREKPGDLSVRGKMANALLWGRDYSDAMREFKDLNMIEPGDTAHLLGMARAAAGAKNYALAAETFHKLFIMNRLPESSLMEYAWLLHDMDKPNELRDISRTTLSRSESAEYSPQNLISLNSWAENWSKAKAIMESTAGSSNDREFLLRRIALNDRLGNTDDVLKDYTRLSDLEPDNVKYLLTIAHILQGKGDFDNAALALQAALKREQDNIDIKREIALNYSYMSNLDETVRWYREILASKPDDKQAIDGLVLALLWNEKYEEAREYVEKAFRENPNDRNARVNMATVYSRLGKEDEALAIVEDLLDRDSLSESEKERIAMNALASNSNRLLLRLIGAGAMGDEKVTQLRLLLARRLRAQGQHATALPIYAAVLASTPSPSPELIMEMAETANWAKRPDIATRWLEIAMNIVANRKKTVSPASAASEPDPVHHGLLLSSKEWESLLRPLRRQPMIYESLSGFERQFSLEGKNLK